MVSSMRLSVIIPGYNTPKDWWVRCVGSVLKAIGPDDEIVLVDDGSVEARRVDRAWWADGRVRVIYKENGGLSSARNAALEVIRGKYVTFVDSDDEILPETFERCIGRLEKTGYDIAIYGVKVIWVDERLTKTDVPEDADVGKLTPEGVLGLVRRRLFNYACNKVYRADFLNGRGRDGEEILFSAEGMPCEDSIFNLCCVQNDATWCTVDYPGYVYYRTGGTLLSTYKKTGLRGLKLNSDVWASYCAQTHSDPRPYEGWAILSEDDLWKREWENIWNKNSPYGLLGRYRWLASARRGFLWNVRTWLAAAVRTLLKRWCYFRFVRRYRLRKCFGAGVKEWEG